jgi:hypothetical protein
MRAYRPINRSKSQRQLHDIGKLLGARQARGQAEYGIYIPLGDVDAFAVECCCAPPPLHRKIFQTSRLMRREHPWSDHRFDRIGEEEGVALDVAIGKHDGDAGRVEHTGAAIGVVHFDLGLAANISVDSEGIGDRTRPAEEAIDGKGGAS